MVAINHLQLVCQSRFEGRGDAKPLKLKKFVEFNGFSAGPTTVFPTHLRRGIPGKLQNCSHSVLAHSISGVSGLNRIREFNLSLSVTEILCDKRDSTASFLIGCHCDLTYRARSSAFLKCGTPFGAIQAATKD
jgi:hypothetical protein